MFDKLLEELRRYNNDETEDLRRAAADVIEDLVRLLNKSEQDKPKWISVEDRLPPPAKLEQYLIRVRSGGPIYGGWEYDTDLGWWGEYWGPNGSHGYDWHSILNDWDGEVTITHWMRIPDPPEQEGEE